MIDIDALIAKARALYPDKDLSDTQLLCASLFKDQYGSPILLTPGQDLIYRAIVLKDDPRVFVNCYTQYGKSMTVALAILTRCMIFPERWYIVAGKVNKAGIIMAHITDHILDNDVLKAMFAKSPGNDIEEIKKHRSKSHVTFTLPSTDGAVRVSEIMIGSANDALGFGSQNVVLDEAALVEDADEALVLRMLLGKPDNFYMKIGNPFRRNHFYQSSIDPKWTKIILDVWHGLSEGRIKREEITETEGKPFFSILYGCQFPRADQVDDEGWLFLVMEDEIREAVARKHENFGIKRLGIDVARGGRNENVCVLRTNNTAKRLWKSTEGDLMEVANLVANTIREHNVNPHDVYIDDTGVGGGVTDRLHQMGYNVNGVKFGESPQGDGNPDSEATKKAKATYLNVRAEIYAGPDGLLNWLKRTGRLIVDDDPLIWDELKTIRYRTNLERKLQLEPKDDMRSRGVDSPDTADALAITFAKRTVKMKIRMKAHIHHGGATPLDPSLGLMT